MANVGELIVEIGANDKGLTKGLGKAQDAIKNVGKIAAVGAGAVAALGVAMFKTAEKTAATTDRIDKLSQRLGLSREGFQEWEFVLSQAGTSIDSVQMGMKTLAQRMNEAIEGAGRGSELFDQLGISISESMTQEEAFNATVKALQNMEDGVKKAALAQELFGRTGQELLPLLNSTAESTEQLKEKARELGLVISSDAVDAGVLFTDTMDQLKRSLGAIFTEIGVVVMPIIQEFAEYIVDNMPTIKAVMSNVFETISTVVSVAYGWFKDYILPVLEMVYEFIVSNYPLMQEIAVKAFEALVTYAQIVWDFYQQNLIPIIMQIWDVAKDVFPSVKELASNAFVLIEEVAKAAWIVFQDFLIPVFESLFEISKTVFPVIAEKIGSSFKEIINIANTLIKVVTTVIETVTKALKAVKEFASASANSSGGGGGFGVGKVTPTGTLSTGQKYYGDPAGVATLERLSGARANGGPTPAGQSFLVGERGPEIFTPSTSGVITPNNRIGVGQTVININVQGSDPWETADEVVRILNRQGVFAQ